MTRLFFITRCAALTLVAALVSAIPAAAQTITTGSISGVVEDQQGGRLPGATALATHTATGTTYTAVSQTDGRFVILNVRVGAYAVKVTMPSFKDNEQKDVVVSLGEDRALSFKMDLATLTSDVTVVAETSPINLSMAGTAGNVPNEVKETLPTISRGLNDLARTNVYFVPNGFNDDTPSAAVAGRSQRYNSLQIDGAVNNDLFGLAAAGGVPGGNAGTQPISLDAILELQLVVSPYDIRQSGFSGGGINAITKSGANQMHGTVFYFGRNQSWVGKGITKTPISTFSDSQTGFSIGGPIAQNKAFYFGTADFGRKKTPSGFSVVGSGVQTGNEAAVDRFLSILRDKYGYDLGPTAKDEFTRETDNNKVFLRADFNLANRHQLTVRHNFVDALNDNGFPSKEIYRMPDTFYRFNSVTNSTVTQLTSRVGMGVNELRVAITSVAERRDPGPAEPRTFPFVDVTVAPGLRVQAGRDATSSANELDQDIIEITDDFTKVAGKHTLTFGTHNEFFKFRNLFIRDFFGNYSFGSLDLFEQGLAQSYDHSFSNTSDPRLPARFNVNHMGFYAGDQWRVAGNLTLTYGARVDLVRYPDTPSANPAAEAAFGYKTDVVPNNTLWSPRVGFNWDRKGNGTEQIRGGVGLFAGRPPYVWVSNQYGNTGVDFTRLRVAFNNNNRIAFVSDPDNQPTSLTGVPFQQNEIDLIDPDFKYPSIIRGNLAYDRKLPLGLYGTVELLFSSVAQDIRYENLNLTEIRTLLYQPVDTNQAPVSYDSRPVYGTKVSSLSNALLLTNSKDGSTWSIAGEVKRPFKNGFFVNVSYLYGEATSTMDGTRDQAISMWAAAYVPGDPNHPPLARSDYDPGHRFSITGSYDFALGGGYSAIASVYYSGQSGRPYSFAWDTPGVNGDGQAFNDLLYLPNAGEVNTTNGTYQDLLLFMQLEDCSRAQIGKVFKRNSCRAPWTNTMDARFAVKLPVRHRVNAEITLDILNLVNLFDPSGGQVRYAAFNEVTTPFRPVFSNNVLTSINLAALTTPGFTRYTRSDLRSRWQMQLGGRLRF